MYPAIMPMVSIPINPTPGMENKVCALFIETSRSDAPAHGPTPSMVTMIHIGLNGSHCRCVESSPHALPDENADDGAHRGDDDFADDVGGAKPEQAGEKAAHHRTDDTDQQVDQQVLLAP